MYHLEKVNIVLKIKFSGNDYPLGLVYTNINHNQKVIIMKSIKSINTSRFATFKFNTVAGLSMACFTLFGVAHVQASNLKIEHAKMVDAPTPLCMAIIKGDINIVKKFLIYFPLILLYIFFKLLLNYISNVFSCQWKQRF